MRYLYCHPLFDERKCAHRFSFALWQTFQEAGLNLERFDYRGTGEGPGDFADVTLQSLREDLAQRIQVDSVCIIGTRFGASLALDYAVRSTKSPPILILIEPIINGAKYVHYLSQKQHIKDLMTGNSRNILTEKDYRNFEGYKTNERFIEQLKKFNLLEEINKSRMESLVVFIRMMQSSESGHEFCSLVKFLESASKEIVVENVNLPVFWERIPDADYNEFTHKLLRWCIE